MRTPPKVSAKKFEAVVEELLQAVHGCCVSSKACIGQFDGKQIVLQVVVDKDSIDYLKIHNRKCISFPGAPISKAK